MTYSTKNLLVHEPTKYSKYEKLYLWEKGEVFVEVVQDRYTCNGGCSACDPSYSLDSNK